MFSSFRLLQLADSALPLGGFAFSSGLEWLVKSEVIQTVDDLYAHLCAVMDQAAAYELQYSISLYACAASSKHRAELADALADYDLQMYLPLQRKASLAQGAAWLELLPRLYGRDQGAELTAELRELQSGHFLPLFALSLCAGSDPPSLEHLCALQLHLLIRDQLSAAIRLGAIGPSASVQLQSATLQRAQQILGTMADQLQNPDPLAYMNARKSNPMLDMAFADHQQLYAKLFQN